MRSDSEIEKEMFYITVGRVRTSSLLGMLLSSGEGGGLLELPP